MPLFERTMWNVRIRGAPHFLGMRTGANIDQLDLEGKSVLK